MKLYRGNCHSHWPALSSGDSEECQESPQNVVIVKLILLPLSGLSCHIVFVIVKEMTPETDRRRDTIRGKANKKQQSKRVYSQDEALKTKEIQRSQDKVISKKLLEGCLQALKI